MSKKLPIIAALLVAIGFMVLRPVPIVKESEALEVKGIVATVYETGVKDVQIRLKGDSRRFYINRGLEQGLDLFDLQNRLMGSPVTLKYPDYWTPLDWNKQNIHISKLEFENGVIYNELKAD